MNLTGKKLGKYELQHRLGQGGMAQVYTAIQPTIDRKVAIKVMHSYLTETENFITRFKREAKALGRLRHPHIVQVLDFDYEPELDIYFMVMDYVGGGDLSRFLREEKILSPGRSLRIARQLASALDHAHQQGMIHRDLKPSNVLFRGQAHQHAILTDFGITHLLHDKRLTESGSMPGTPAYISPEAVQGKKVDARTDLYSLGVMLYEMVTGVMPFDGDTSIIVMLKHVQEQLPDLRTNYPNLPVGVIEIIERLMEKDPADRYPSAAELESAINAVLPTISGDNPVTYVPPVTSPSDLPTATNDVLEVEADVASTNLMSDVDSRELGLLPEAQETILEPVTPATAATVLDPTPVPAPAAPSAAAADEKPPRRIWRWVGIGIVGILAVCGLLSILSVLGGSEEPPADPFVVVDEEGGVDIEEFDFEAASVFLEETFEGGIEDLAQRRPDSIGTVTLSLDDQVHILEIGPDPNIINVSEELDELGRFAEGYDEWMSVSRNGEWFLISTARGFPECRDWPCLAVTNRDDPEPRFVRFGTPPTQFVHADWVSAISFDGMQIVFEADFGPHESDLFLIEKRPNREGWTEPELLTGDFDFNYHSKPTFGIDGTHLYFNCGWQPYGQQETSICKIDLETREVSLIVDSYFHPTADETSFARDPYVRTDGVLIFESNWGGIQRLWRAEFNPEGGVDPGVFHPFHIDDSLSCPLPNGDVVSLWYGNLLQESDGPQLKLMTPNGDQHFVLLDDAPIGDAWLSCGGG